MNTQKPKPIFHPRIFWDVQFDTIDYDNRARFVIERVFERGDVEDIRQCRRYYGDDKIREILLKTQYLPERRIYLAAAVLAEPLTNFLCYKLRQSNPTHLPY
ncbi:MAG: hypothetical protein IT256_03565 [Chitinophagaceae bacterium]|nr:hypothetical protein [Chitinophagaceae bacterium]